MNSLTLEQLIMLLPELLLLVLAVIIMLLPERARTMAWLVAVGGLAADLLMCLSLWGVNDYIMGGAYAVNNFAVLVKVMLLGLAMLNVIGSHDFTARVYRAREYYALLLMAMLGLLIIPSSTDFITLVVAFELVSITTYVLPLAELNNPQGGEAEIFYQRRLCFSFDFVWSFLIIWFYRHDEFAELCAGDGHIGSAPIAACSFGVAAGRFWL